MIVGQNKEVTIQPCILLQVVYSQVLGSNDWYRAARTMEPW